MNLLRITNLNTNKVKLISPSRVLYQVNGKVLVEGLVSNSGNWIKLCEYNDNSSSGDLRNLLIQVEEYKRANNDLRLLPYRNTVLPSTGSWLNEKDIALWRQLYLEKAAQSPILNLNNQLSSIYACYIITVIV